MQSIDIVSEPTNSIYGQLLDLALEFCETFSLVWRDQLDFNTEARELEERLQLWLLSETRGSIWPGTELIGHKATIRFYQLNAKSVEVLVSVGGLYGWLAPSKPEDLALYSSDGTVWLGSITHERDAWLELPEQDAAAVRLRIQKILEGNEQNA